MRPLRLAVVCFSRARGGLELKLIELAALLLERGHHVEMVVPPNTPLAVDAESRGVPVVPLTPRMRYLDLPTATRLSRRVRKGKIEVLLIGRSQDVSTARLAALLAGRGALVFLQQMQFDIPKRDLFHRWAYGGLDLWLTLTRKMRDAVVRNTTVPAERIHVIPLGIDLTRFTPAGQERRKARERFSLPPSGMLVSVIGRFDPQKGQEHLLRALPAIRQRVPDVTVALMGEETRGESGYGRYLQKLADELGVRAVVRVLPFTQEVPAFLQATDLIVLPSLSETYGYVLIEALAMGIPVVATEGGGVPEIVEEGRTGLLVPPADPEALASAVTRILTDNALREAMATAARETALSRFDLRRQADELATLLKKTLDERTQRGD